MAPSAPVGDHNATVGEVAGTARPGKRARHAFARQVGRGLLTSVALAAALMPVGLWLRRLSSMSDPVSRTVLRLDHGLVRAGTDLVRTHPPLHEFMLWWAGATQPWRVYAVAVPLVAAVAYLQTRRPPRAGSDAAGRRINWRGRAYRAVAAMMSTWAIAAILKELTGRPRPFVPFPVGHAEGFSFPSGHATNAMAAAVTLALFVWPALGRGGRVTAGVLGAVFVLLTGANRVFLGVHYPTDVVAGFMLGAGIVTVMWRATRASSALAEPTAK